MIFWMLFFGLFWLVYVLARAMLMLVWLFFWLLASVGSALILVLTGTYRRRTP